MTYRVHNRYNDGTTTVEDFDNFSDAYDAMTGDYSAIEEIKEGA